ncbi:MAG: adenosylcobinamide-GDP ribazoletransferase [Pseudomonadota bacterium]
MKGLTTALRTLTLIPAPGRESDHLSSSLPWFPLVGFVLGLLLYALALLWTWLIPGDWPEGGAAILLIAGIILTRGLHLDGLADWADALGGHGEKEHRLTIMKDAHLGAFGVLALVMALLLKWVTITRLFSDGSLFWLFPVLMISRAMMVELISTLPYARAGEGTARPFVQGSSSKSRFIAHFSSIMVCLFFSLGGLFLFFVGWITTRLLGHSFKRGFGGITGDLLGTTNELVEIILLMICALYGTSLFKLIPYWRGPF